VILTQWRGGSPVGGGARNQFEIRVPVSAELTVATVTGVLVDTREGRTITMMTLYRLGAEYNNAGEKANYEGQLDAE